MEVNFDRIVEKHGSAAVTPRLAVDVSIVLPLWTFLLLVVVYDYIFGPDAGFVAPCD